MYDDSTIIEHSWAHPEDFADIFDRHFATIHRYLARRAGSDTADDLASEVFTVALARRHSYDLARSSALPWLYGIAANVLRADQRRGRHRTAVIEPEVPLPDGAEPFEDQVVASLDARRALHALRPAWEQLSDDDMTTLLLYAWEDLSYEDIAVALMIPVGTVRSRLNRVRRRLREPEQGETTRTIRTTTLRSKELDR